MAPAGATDGEIAVWFRRLKSEKAPVREHAARRLRQLGYDPAGPPPAPVVKSDRGGPGLVRQALNAAGAAARALRAAAAGERVLASPEEAARRLAICQGDPVAGTPKCEMFDPARNKCGGCGCWVSFKRALETEKDWCPLRKW